MGEGFLNFSGLWASEGPALEGFWHLSVCSANTGWYTVPPLNCRGPSSSANCYCFTQCLYQSQHGLLKAGRAVSVILFPHYHLSYDLPLCRYPRLSFSTKSIQVPRETSSSQAFSQQSCWIQVGLNTHPHGTWELYVPQVLRESSNTKRPSTLWWIICKVGSLERTERKAWTLLLKNESLSHFSHSSHFFQGWIQSFWQQ